MPKLLIVVVSLLAVALLAACGQAEDSSPTATPTPAAEPTPTPTQPPSGVGGGGGDLGVATVVPPPTPPSAAFTTYVDPVLGFSLDYPPDLAFTDLTGPSGGPGRRAIEFRSPEDPSRGFAISVSANPKGLTPELWALEFTACLPKTIRQATVAEKAAVFCTAEPLDGKFEAGAVFAHGGSIFFISSTIVPSEFELMVGSFRL